jgi:hypothetical protein
MGAFPEMFFPRIFRLGGSHLDRGSRRNHSGFASIQITEGRAVAFRTLAWIAIIFVSSAPPVRATSLRISFFNRSGVPLRLVPVAGAPGGSNARVEATCHDLPRLDIRKQVIDFRGEALPGVDVAPESLLYLDIQAISGRRRAGATFQVMADPADPEAARMVGSLFIPGEARAEGGAHLEVHLTAAFMVERNHDRPWDAVVRSLGWDDAVREAQAAGEVELAREKEKEMEKARLLQSCILQYVFTIQDLNDTFGIQCSAADWRTSISAVNRRQAAIDEGDSLYAMHAPRPQETEAR